MPSDRPQYNFELARVRTFDDFRREMSRHFKLDPDHAKVWSSISIGLLYQPSASTFRFHGWDEFKTHMPRYARHLVRLIRSYQKATSERTYTIELVSSEAGR
jgi:hypothetical protein